MVNTTELTRDRIEYERGYDRLSSAVHLGQSERHTWMACLLFSKCGNVSLLVDSRKARTQSLTRYVSSNRAIDGVEPEPARAALISAMAAHAAALHRSGTPLYTRSGSYTV